MQEYKFTFNYGDTGAVTMSLSAAPGKKAATPPPVNSCLDANDWQQLCSVWYVLW